MMSVNTEVQLQLKVAASPTTLQARLVFVSSSARASTLIRASICFRGCALSSPVVTG